MMERYEAYDYSKTVCVVNGQVVKNNKKRKGVHYIEPINKKNSKAGRVAAAGAIGVGYFGLRTIASLAKRYM